MERHDELAATHPSRRLPTPATFTLSGTASPVATPVWISPFHFQDSITLSVSGQPGADYWDFLRDVDAILCRFKARPHWGKMHFLDTGDVTALYPRANDFRALRRKLDPRGRFLNDHVRALLG